MPCVHPYDFARSELIARNSVQANRERTSAYLCDAGGRGVHQCDACDVRDPRDYRRDGVWATRGHTDRNAEQRRDERLRIRVPSITACRRQKTIVLIN